MPESDKIPFLDNSVKTETYRRDEEWIPGLDHTGRVEKIGTLVTTVREDDISAGSEYGNIIRQVRDEKSPDLYGDSKPNESMLYADQRPIKEDLDTKMPHKDHDSHSMDEQMRRSRSFEKSWETSSDKSKIPEKPKEWNRSPPIYFDRDHSRSPERKPERRIISVSKKETSVVGRKSYEEVRETAGSRRPNSPEMPRYDHIRRNDSDVRDDRFSSRMAESDRSDIFRERNRYDSREIIREEQAERRDHSRERFVRRESFDKNDERQFGSERYNRDGRGDEFIDKGRAERQEFFDRGRRLERDEFIERDKRSERDEFIDRGKKSERDGFIGRQIRPEQNENLATDRRYNSGTSSQERNEFYQKDIHSGRDEIGHRSERDSYRYDERQAMEVTGDYDRSGSLYEKRFQSPELVRNIRPPEFKKEPEPRYDKNEKLESDMFQMETKDEKAFEQNRLKLFETYVPRAVKLKQHSHEKDHNPENYMPVKGEVSERRTEGFDKSNRADERNNRALSREDKEWEQTDYRTIQVKHRDSSKKVSNENIQWDGRGDETRYQRRHSPTSDYSRSRNREDSPYSRSSRPDNREDYRREPDTRRSRDISRERENERFRGERENERFREDAAYDNRERRQYIDSDRFTGDRTSKDTDEDMPVYRSIEIRPRAVKSNQQRSAPRSPDSSYQQSYQRTVQRNTGESSRDEGNRRRYSQSPLRRDISSSRNRSPQPERNQRYVVHSPVHKKYRSPSRSPDRKVYKSTDQKYRKQELHDSLKERKVDNSGSGSPHRKYNETLKSQSKFRTRSRSRSRSTSRSGSRKRRSPNDKRGYMSKKMERHSRSRSRSRNRSFTSRSRSPENRRRSAKSQKDQSESAKKNKRRYSKEPEKTDPVPVPAIPSKWDSPEPKRNRWEEPPSSSDLNMPLVINKAHEIASLLKIPSIPESPPPHRKMKPHEKQAMEKKWSQLLSPPRLYHPPEPKESKSNTSKKIPADENTQEIKKDSDSNKNPEDLKKQSEKIPVSSKSENLVKRAKLNLRSRWDSESSSSDKSRSRSRSKDRRQKSHEKDISREKRYSSEERNSKKEIKSGGKKQDESKYDKHKREQSHKKDQSDRRRSRDRSRDRHRRDSGNRDKKQELPDIVRSAKKPGKKFEPKVFWFHNEAFEDAKKKEKAKGSLQRDTKSKKSSSSRLNTRRSRSTSSSGSSGSTPRVTRAGVVSMEKLKKKHKRSKSSESSSSSSSPKKKKSTKDEKSGGKRQSLDDLESFLGDLKKEKKKQWIAEGKVKQADK